MAHQKLKLKVVNHGASGGMWMYNYAALPVLLVLFVLAGDAHAYLDPGTGSILLQALAAAVLAAGVFWQRILTFVKGLFRK